MKELIRFNYDAKEITINTELLKKIFFGSNKEVIKWLVQSINSQNVNNGGRGEIRTHGGYEPTSVFKTGALNRSATLP